MIAPGYSWLALAVGLSWLPAAHAADRTLIVQELKKLRDSLPSADYQRRELNLRIADLLSQSCLTVASSPSDAARLKACQEAFLLYSEAVGSSSPALAPQMSVKISYQMARIALERGDSGAAQALFETVFNRAEAVELKRESALRLAEIAESLGASQAGAEAQAERWYQAALALCSGTDACSFARYRMAWVKKRQGQLLGAIQEMREAIYDSKGQARPEAIRDLVQFMGQEPAHTQEYIDFIEQLAGKLALPTLLSDLGSAYFASGHKAEGLKVLELVQARNPSIAQNFQLLEEYYGLRNWERFEFHLSALEERAVSNTSGNSFGNSSGELQSVAKRLALQLDGERATQPARAQEYLRVSQLTLKLFPSISDRQQLMEGVIAAMTDADQKLGQLKSWLADTQFQLTAAEKLALHELRIGIAQKSSRYPVVVEEADALLALSPSANNEKRRAYEYARAKALYDQKSWDAALVGFKAISEAGLNLAEGPDSFAVQAQNLALDVLNQRKDYDGLMAQAGLWTQNSRLQQLAARAGSSLAGELKEMTTVSQQAEFEKAVSLGQTDGALKLFKRLCEADLFLPKSCENTKVLATALNRHNDLVAVLKKQGDRAALVQELEAGGDFDEAAQTLEKFPTAWTQAASAPQSIARELKIALLYELGGKIADRDRVLSSLLPRLSKGQLRLAEPEQLALVMTLADSGVLTSAWLKVTGWSVAAQAQLAEKLESQGKGSAETAKRLLAHLSSTGPAWEKAVWNEFARLEQLQAKIGFHTADGQRQFQRRVSALKAMNQFLEKYLPGASPELRVRMLQQLEGSHLALAQEIRTSPIPPNLTDEQKVQIDAGIAEMARPFEERAQALKQLAQAEPVPSGATVQAAATSQAPVLVHDALRPYLSQLAENPESVPALNALKTLYESHGMNRLARYYEGRLVGSSGALGSQEANHP